MGALAPGSLMKEPELVFETERHWLDIVRLASMHSLGSGVRLPNVRGSEQEFTCIRQFNAYTLGFFPLDKRDASQDLCVWECE